MSGYTASREDPNDSSDRDSRDHRCLNCLKIPFLVPFPRRLLGLVVLFRLASPLLNVLQFQPRLPLRVRYHSLRLGHVPLGLFLRRHCSQPDVRLSRLSNIGVQATADPVEQYLHTPNNHMEVLVGELIASKPPTPGA